MLERLSLSSVVCMTAYATRQVVSIFGNVRSVCVAGRQCVMALVTGSSVCSGVGTGSPLVCRLRDEVAVYVGAVRQVGGQAVLGRQDASPTPWLTERHGYDPTCA